MNILFKKARVIDPENKVDQILDVLVINGKIASLSPNIINNNVRNIDCKDKILAPGFIDTHTHLNCSIQSLEDNIESETQAAVAGGFTTISCMPDVKPSIDNPNSFIILNNLIKRYSRTNVFIIGALTIKMLGKELAYLDGLYNEGVIAFSDDRPIKDSMMLRNAFRYVGQYQVPIFLNCEDCFLTENGVVNEGFIQIITGLNSRPSIAEAIMVYRDVLLALEEKAKVNILNITCSKSIEAIKYFKLKNSNIFTSITPYYFSLTDDWCINFNTNAKFQPPLRDKNDLNSLKEGIKEGLIDVIASGHEPCTIDEKNVVFNQARSGATSLELVLTLLLSEIVFPKVLDFSEAISKLTINPAKLLGINKGTLGIGKEADIVVFDPQMEWLITQDTLHSKGKNTPLLNKKVKGKVIYTIVGGDIKYSYEKSIK